MSNAFWFGAIAPERVAFGFGPISVYWYGILMVLAILAAFYVVRNQYLKQNADDKDFVDMVFYLTIWGIIGARAWHVFVFQWQYYAAHPSEILAIWQGGIAIHGALIAGLLYLLYRVKRKSLDLFYFTDLLAPGVALGQAIGRWGNFFNQELYGLPTSLPWGIYIDENNRVPGFETFSRFHPTFLYESISNLILFLMLLFLIRTKSRRGSVTALYFIGYGSIRFLVDFARIDPMPSIAGLRLSQYISLLFILFGLALIIYQRNHASKSIAKS